MENNVNLVNQEEIDCIIENYDRLNNLGVKFYNLKLLFDYLVKIIVFSIVAII